MILWMTIVLSALGEILGRFVGFWWRAEQENEEQETPDFSDCP